MSDNTVSLDVLQLLAVQVSQQQVSLKVANHQLEECLLSTCSRTKTTYWHHPEKNRHFRYHLLQAGRLLYVLYQMVPNQATVPQAVVHRQ